MESSNVWDDLNYQSGYSLSAIKRAAPAKEDELIQPEIPEPEPVTRKQRVKALTAILQNVISSAADLSWVTQHITAYPGDPSTSDFVDLLSAVKNLLQVEIRMLIETLDEEVPGYVIQLQAAVKAPISKTGLAIIHNFADRSKYRFLEP
jgi:hypothetical protein